jgi:hypothetical protein
MNKQVTAHKFLKMPKEIATLNDAAIGDNALYYDYSTKHLARLEKQGIDREDPQFLSAYRSFEGEVFENVIYELLLRHALRHPDITEFIIKGPHKQRTKALGNALSISSKGQIVYRTKSKEIGEFDALFCAGDELYFVEMTLVKSVSNLKKRLRKKKALLNVLFPSYTVKCLIIVNEGATGVKQLPSYCTTWITKPYSAQRYYQSIVIEGNKSKKPFKKVTGKNLAGTKKLVAHPFRYYNTLAWVFTGLRNHPKYIFNMTFLKRPDVTRYIDLFTKIYIGYMDGNEFKKRYPAINKEVPQRVMVSIDKEHTGELTLAYYFQYSRKNLLYVKPNSEGAIKVEKKDPFGITVTEVVHIFKITNERHALTSQDISKIETLLRKMPVQYNAL